MWAIRSYFRWIFNWIIIRVGRSRGGGVVADTVQTESNWNNESDLLYLRRSARNTKTSSRRLDINLYYILFIFSIVMVFFLSKSMEKSGDSQGKFGSKKSKFGGKK